MTYETVEIVVALESDGPTKGPWSSDTITGAVERRVDELRDTLAEEVTRIGRVLGGLQRTVGDFECDEVDLTLEATASGGFRLVSSAEASVGATVALKFRRKSPAATD